MKRFSNFMEEKRTRLHNVLIGHILRINCIHDAIEAQMTELKGVEKKKTQLLDKKQRKILGAKRGS